MTQAKNDQCYIYYVGSTDQKGNDISELQAHIASAIGGTIPGDLTYSPSKVQMHPITHIFLRLVNQWVACHVKVPIRGDDPLPQAGNQALGSARLAGFPQTKDLWVMGWVQMASGISRSWYNAEKNVGVLKTSPCGIPGERGGKDCDEYPFFSTLEGGPVRYKEGKVSLRLVNPDHNRNQGSTLGGFYRSCFRFANGTAFVVKPGGSTHGEAFTKASRKQCWPRAEIPDYVPESDDNQD